MPRPTSLRAAHKARTRDALVAAAVALFRARGFEATTIDEIAAAAGVSRRTFFRYFPTKDAVVFPHADARVARFEELLRPARGEAPLDTVRRAFRGIGAELAAHRDELLLQRELIARSPVLLAREAEIDRRWEAALVDALQGRRRGAAARRRVRILGGAVMGAMRAALNEWFDSGGQGDLETVGEEALDLVARTLA